MVDQNPVCHAHPGNDEPAQTFATARTGVIVGAVVGVVASITIIMSSCSSVSREEFTKTN